jgi:hypothetical protein
MDWSSLDIDPNIKVSASMLLGMLCEEGTNGPRQ